MKHWELAQFNVATMLYPRDDERVAGFFQRIAEINALADSADGFVWRLDDDGGEVSNGTVVSNGNAPFTVANLSVWESIEALHAFVYRSEHRELIAKRKDWFERPSEAIQVLWWIPRGVRPTLEESTEKLRLIEANGPTADYFSFKQSFRPPKSN